MPAVGTAEWLGSVRCLTREFALAAALSAALGTLLHRAGCDPLAVALIASLFASMVIFSFALEHRNASIHGPMWHLAPPLIGAYWLYARASLRPMNVTEALRSVAMLTVLSLWSLRHTWNWLRGWEGYGREDWRHAQARRSMAACGFPSSLCWLAVSLGFHLMPAIILFSAMLPFALALAEHEGAPVARGALDALALLVGLAGVGMQAVADDELFRFRQSAAAGSGAALTDAGLWRFCRHPNYCGELLHWLAYVLFALGAGAGRRRQHHLLLAGPVPVLLLLVCVSLPLLEARLACRAGYAHYQATVSALVPLPRFAARGRTG